MYYFIKGIIRKHCFTLSDTELVFLDSEGGLSILEVNSLTQNQIVSNIVFVSIRCCGCFSWLFFQQKIFKLIFTKQQRNILYQMYQKRITHFKAGNL